MEAFRLSPNELHPLFSFSSRKTPKEHKPPFVLFLFSFLQTSKPSSLDAKFWHPQTETNKNPPPLLLFLQSPKK